MYTATVVFNSTASLFPKLGPLEKAMLEPPPPPSLTPGRVGGNEIGCVFANPDDKVAHVNAAFGRRPAGLPWGQATHATSPAVWRRVQFPLLSRGTAGR